MSSKTSFQATARLSLIAAAALATTAGVANAQSNVTLYGRVDAGVQFTDKSARADDSLSELSNGGNPPEHLGPEGQRRPGWRPEGRVQPRSPLLDRQRRPPPARALAVWVRVASAVKPTSASRATWAPCCWAVSTARPSWPTWAPSRALSRSSSRVCTRTPSCRTRASNTTNDLGIFLGNAVSYSNNFGPVYVGAAVAAGEGTGRSYTIAGSYTGPVTLSASYQADRTGSGPRRFEAHDVWCGSAFRPDHDQGQLPAR